MTFNISAGVNVRVERGMLTSALFIGGLVLLGILTVGRGQKRTL